MAGIYVVLRVIAQALYQLEITNAQTDRLNDEIPPYALAHALSQA